MIAPGQVKRKPGQGSWVLSRHTINGRTLPEGAGGDSRQPMNSWDLLVRGVLPIGWRFESDCHENWANIQCGAGTLLVFGPGAEWPCPQIQRIRIAAKVSACTYCNVVNAGAQICVFGGKQNCLQEICGKENILRGGGCAALFRLDGLGLAEHALRAWSGIRNGLVRSCCCPAWACPWKHQWVLLYAEERKLPANVTAWIHIGYGAGGLTFAGPAGTVSSHSA